jgi:hypothetical protein
MQLKATTKKSSNPPHVRESVPQLQQTNTPAQQKTKPKTKPLSDTNSPLTLESEPQVQQANKSSAQLKTKPKKKLFNLFTYKLHALGDYVSTIHLFGTTYSYSTQIVRPGLSAPLDTAFTSLQGELSHRLVKRFYHCTNKKRCNTTNCET